MNKTDIDLRAKCRSEGQPTFDSLFSGDYNTKRNVADMRSYCSDCPVVNECREYAIVHEEYCNYGGTTAKERAAIRKTGEYLELLYRAAKEGWLIPRRALGAWEDIQDALWSAGLDPAPAFPASESHPQAFDLELVQFDFQIQPLEIPLGPARISEQTALVH